MIREAIVLAGGLGTRLRKVVSEVPKPMAPVAGRPFLEILLRKLSNKGFSRVVLSIGYKSDLIISYFGDSFAGMEIIYTVEESPLGTGGAVRLAIEKCSADYVYIFNGDTYLDLNIDVIEKQWQSNQRPIIVGLHVRDAARYGKLLVDSGRVVGFSEKGITGPGLINAGVYIFNKKQIHQYPIGLAFSLENDYLVNEIKKGSFDLFLTKGKFIDIGIPEDYERAQRELATV